MLAAVALLALLFVQQQHLIGMPQSGRVASAAPDALHGPWFALVTWLIVQFVGRWTRGGTTLVVTVLIAVALAIGTEALQKLSGGDAEWGDVGWDMIGMSAALCIWSARARRPIRRLAAIGAATILMAVSQWPLAHALLIDRYRDSIAPDLFALDSVFAHDLFTSNSVIDVVAAPRAWRIAHPVLKVTFAQARWPGVHFDDPIADWRAYSALAVEAFVDGSQPLPITISVRLDNAPVDHVYRTFECGPGACSIVLPFAGLFDRDVARVNAVVIYSDRRFAGRVVYLGRVALEK